MPLVTSVISRRQQVEARELGPVCPKGRKRLQLRLGEALRTGRIPIVCGEPASGEEGVEFYVPEDCRIAATFSVPAKVAKWLGLKSRAIAQGVAGDMKDG